MTIRNPLVETLPDWAQEHIQSLYNQVSNLERLVAIQDEKVFSHISRNDWLNNNYHPIPDSCRIKYNLGEHKELEVSYDKADNCIVVSAKGIKKVIVFPSAANVVNIGVQDS